MDSTVAFNLFLIIFSFIGFITPGLIIFSQREDTESTNKKGAKTQSNIIENLVEKIEY